VGENGMLDTKVKERRAYESFIAAAMIENMQYGQGIILPRKSSY
jgi:hypothetical protein